MKTALCEKFAMRDMGPAIQLTSLLAKQSMSDCNPVNTPMEFNKHFEPSTPVTIVTDVPYQQVIGSLTWFPCCTRPDIAYATNRLDQYNKQPQQLNTGMK